MLFSVAKIFSPTGESFRLPTTETVKRGVIAHRMRKTGMSTSSTAGIIEVGIGFAAIASARSARRRRGRVGLARPAIVAAVSLAHTLGLSALARLSTHERQALGSTQPTLTAYIIERPAIPEPPLVPGTSLIGPQIELSLPDLALGDERGMDAGSAQGSASPFVAPRIDPETRIDIAPYAVRAGLAPGRAAAVVLMVEVLADGSVGNIAVERSTGDAAIDAAAMDYVRAASWIPGNLQGQPTAMRIRFAVTLMVRS
jgi:TonB family protein